MMVVPLVAGEGFYTWLEGKRHVSNFLADLPDFSPFHGSVDRPSGRWSDDTVAC